LIFIRVPISFTWIFKHKWNIVSIPSASSDDLTLLWWPLITIMDNWWLLRKAILWLKSSSSLFLYILLRILILFINFTGLLLTLLSTQFRWLVLWSWILLLVWRILIRWYYFRWLIWKTFKIIDFCSATSISHMWWYPKFWLNLLILIKEDQIDLKQRVWRYFIGLVLIS